MLKNIKSNIKNKNLDKNNSKNFLAKISKIDWLSWVILISATVIVAFFLFSEIGFYLIEQKLQKENMERQANLMEFNYNVQNETSTPHEVYEQARQALLNNDLEGVLATMHPAYLWRYEDGLRKAAAEGRLSEAAERMTPLTEKVYDDGWTTVIYKIEPIPGNDSPNPFEGYSERVEFIYNNKGIWKISGI